MYTLKSIVRRGSALGGAVALLVAAVVPSASVFADALNPLTERSLLLSSSAPGYTDTDGSGNPTYAPPGSGPNGKKTGETFSFKVSSDSTSRAIKGMTFQFCTGAAGKCQGPGDNTGDARDKDKANTSFPGYDADDPGTWDTRTPDREANADAWPNGRSDLDVNYSGAVAGTDFQIFVDYNNDNDFADAGENVSALTSWTMAAANKEDYTHSDEMTGKNNFVTLADSGAGITPTPGTRVQVVFKASATDYITNPGSGSFFVKLNTFDTETTGDHVPGGAHNIDGGVTVANVMTDSIHITTKVLETMAFSVGTRNRDNLTVNCTPVSTETGCEGASGNVHRSCDPIQNVNNNRLNLGNPNAEYSLETSRGWDVYSYWRLSSNSSGGATVYYSGNTLANTVGDEIAEMDNEAVSTPGTEQFGLGFVDATTEDTPSTEFTNAIAADTTGRYKVAESFPFRTVDTQTTGKYDIGDLPAQPASTDYDEATGTLFTGQALPGDAKFKFLKSSLNIPEPIAQQNDQVISCATAKMRYVGNIGADTPAGVYTTKINYLAAPQY